MQEVATGHYLRSLQLHLLAKETRVQYDRVPYRLCHRQLRKVILEKIDLDQSWLL